MRIATWNINGIRSLIKYHPWCEHKNYQKILESLEADIICFQETKTTIERLDSDIALIPGYDAYFSMTKNNTAYSGVVTYVKNATFTPSKSEEGISGILNTKNFDKDDQIGYYPTGYSTNELLEIDSEGRTVILDFGAFVLFNVYCPHESNPERLPFKMKFYKILKERVEALIKAGRRVIVAGDINVTHQKIDHCNPEKSVKEQKLISFEDHPARKWFDSFVAPNGLMVDVCRKFHPGRKDMFTCWNQVINARPVNYGTRLDYILASQDLVKCLKNCDIYPNIMGSDHCPVIAEIVEEIREMQPLGGDPTKPPRLCAKYLPKFSGKQQTLKNFFLKTGTKEPKVIVHKESFTTSLSKAKPRTFSNPKTALPSAQASLDKFFKLSTIEESLTSQEFDPKEGGQDISIEDCFSSPIKRGEFEESSQRLDVKDQWKALFTPPPVPKCKVHGEPCKSNRVNKTGQNNGRKFYVCSRPIGSSQNDRCDFFEWASKTSAYSKRPDNEEQTEKGNRAAKKYKTKK
ncbi:hypothetical protein G9A89_011341 [Geosiphon pyriformis]|nr:hypothetical protein G9A89_011341 [Geosiphon pyriformis]